MRRTSYQQGSLKLADRKKGRAWEFRWREVQLDGSIRRKNIVIGTLKDITNESAARSAVDALRLSINQQTPQQILKNISVETLVRHYREHELPDIFRKTKPAPEAAEENHKSYATQVTYDGYLTNWILPRWRSYRLSDVKAVDVEKWLRTLCFQEPAVALARGSKAKIRNIMSALYSHAIRWEWTERNPITSVRQSAKRQKVPEILTAEEILAILKELPEPLRTMIELGAFTGLRRGELIGLRWEDVDFEVLVLHVRRSVVAMVQGGPKTEASQKDVPLDAQLAESLFTWRQRCAYPASGDWVFASPHMKGKQPYWPGTMWRYYGRPALKRAKVTKNVTYHTFRHTFGTLLNANGENPKVVQELLRHASLKVTTDVYMQAVNSQKREAQSKLVNLVMKAESGTK
jgi:integrase